MKEMVRRALVAIRNERFIFEATAKQGYSGEMNDVVTSADRAAQAIYVKLMREQFPTFGIIAEEDDLRVPCTDPVFTDMVFTVDPLDGTKAMSRRQSHGIGTMISLVCGDKVIAACVGDVMTQEIYYYRPESDNVWRVSEFERSEPLVAPAGQVAKNLVLLLRQRPENHASKTARALAQHPAKGGAFKDIEIASGSIGISMARLWKGEVGAALIGTPHETPWDANPVIGITQKLGFEFMVLRQERISAERIQRPPLRAIVRQPTDYELLIVQRDLIPQIQAWVTAHADD